MVWDHMKSSNIMVPIPTAQRGIDRHKCAACAYESGYKAGYDLNSDLNINSVLSNIEESQVGAQRHKSPHVAYA